jgi:hypothetical protein
VATVALDVGYDSEAAFGKPPATWRRERAAMAA